jgi:regulator of cell morphogenesis and NO signaling
MHAASRKSHTIRQLFRTRPLAIELFEEIAGYRCWAHLDDLVSDFCAKLDLNDESLRQRVLELPPSLEKQNWNKVPLYHLVDHLIENHHHFRSFHIQAIQLLFDSADFQSRPQAKILAPIRAEFDAFKQDFLWHMEEEEGFLFPKILRTEACMRHRELYPEIFKGSVSMYSSAQIHSPEETFKHMLESLIQKVRVLADEDFPGSGIAEAIRTLKAFQAELIAHIGLESEILFPRAIRLENELKKRMGESAPKTTAMP